MPIVTTKAWLLDTETGEYLEPLIGAKGASTPPPSPTEKALQQKQIDLISQQQFWARQQESEQQALAPYLYAQMGLKRIEDPARGKSIADIQARLEAEQAWLNKSGKPDHVWYKNGKAVRIREPRNGTRRVFGMQDLSQKLGPVSNVFNPGGIFGKKGDTWRDFTPAEKEWAIRYNTARDLEAELGKIQSTPVKYTFERMSDEERLAQMTPDERSSYDIRMLANERTKKALEGKLDVDSSVEADIQRGEAQLRQELSQRLGAGAEGSDSWNRAISEFNRNMDALRYSVRHGEMTTADAIATNRIEQNMRRQEQALGNIGNATNRYAMASATSSPASAGMESALSRFYNMRRDAAGIDLQNRASQGSLIGAGIGGGVAIGGAAIIAI